MNNPCENMKDKLTDYVLGFLDDKDIAVVDEHIESCPECKEHLRLLQNEKNALLQLCENIDSQIETRQGKVIEALEEISSEKTRSSSIFRIFSSRITKIAAAAVVAIAVLIPLSYGTSIIIRGLIAGSVEYDDYQGEFSLNRDISFPLEVGNNENESVVEFSNIRFFVEDDELRATLRCYVSCQPKYKWMTTIELLDAQDKRLVYTEHVNENSGAEVLTYESFPCNIHFSLGQWTNASQTHKLRISLRKVPDDTETTPDAWIESSELTVVHGHVTDPNGKPIANAIIQIRQKREPGMDGIAAPEVITDKQGFYCYDAIEWQYHVGVLLLEKDVDGQDYRFQYKRLNKYFEGSQIIDFNIDDFPAGSSAIFGKMESSDGQPVKGFSIALQLEVDFNDYSQEYLYQFGYRKFFNIEDGRFEINDLPAGDYDLTIYPTNDEFMETEDYIQRKKYVCQLNENQKIEIGNENAKGKLLYGRVLFEDGTAAVPDLEGFETQIIRWEEGYSTGTAIAIVNSNGYFTAQISDEVMEQLESGTTWLTVGIGIADEIEVFPVKLLSSERDKAGVVRIKRPTVYYGRILYENDHPAVPEVIPWEGAKVEILFGTRRGLCDVDKEGYFATYFTNEQFEQLKSGAYSLRIYHPSYLEMGTSCSIEYPFDMLSTKKDDVKGYIILPDLIKNDELENLKQIIVSIDKFKQLYTVLESYSQEHDGEYPDSIGTLSLIDTNSDEIRWIVDNYQWFADNLEYINDYYIQEPSNTENIVVAYNKKLLEEYGCTLVLFADGHIEYCWPRQLEILGISTADLP